MAASTRAASHRAAIVASALLSAGFAMALLAGCATPPADPAARVAFEQNNDPLEPFNRKVLDLNQFIDLILLKPATKVYIAVVPEPGRDALRRALDNMKEPVVVINNVLQADPKRAGIAARRFVVNTTFGVAGLLDIAKKWGLDQQTGDFGQTLFVWGFPEGPYLVLPLLGPSNPRDALGMVADNYIDPFSYVATVADADDIDITRFILDGIDQRARVMDVLEDLQKNSLDFYAQLRSLAQQKRAAELRHGAAPAQPAPNFYDVPDEAPGGAASGNGAAPAGPPPGSARP